jgi:hypothetical protein
MGYLLEDYDKEMTRKFCGWSQGIAMLFSFSQLNTPPSSRWMTPLDRLSIFAAVLLKSGPNRTRHRAAFHSTSFKHLSVKLDLGSNQPSNYWPP